MKTPPHAERSGRMQHQQGQIEVTGSFMKVRSPAVQAELNKLRQGLNGHAKTEAGAGPVAGLDAGELTFRSGQALSPAGVP
ncbi:hypothetical protein [Cupriavidus sp. 8B]